MIGIGWTLLKETITGFLANAALSRAASIAYFTIFSLAPLLLIIIAIASLAFNHEVAQRAIVEQLSGLMGKQSGDALQSMLQGASSQGSGTLATLIGVVTLLITASGAFGEIQSDLNTIWKAEPKAGLSRLVRARIASMGLVLTLGFLMLVSLVLSAGLAAFGNYADSIFPAGHAVMAGVDLILSLVLLSAVFAAIYKFLPDTRIAWRDVAVGAVATALLFKGPKALCELQGYVYGAWICMAEVFDALGQMRACAGIACKGSRLV